MSSDSSTWRRKTRASGSSAPSRTRAPTASWWREWGRTASRRTWRGWLAIYYAGGARGYLIASSQGNNTYKVYESGGENRFVLTIEPKAGRLDDVSDTA